MDGGLLDESWLIGKIWKCGGVFPQHCTSLSFSFSLSKFIEVVVAVYGQ